MRILAVDPGKTTGVAIRSRDGRPATWQLPVNDAVDMCIEYIREEMRLLVVCESFIPRPGAKTWQPDAVETIGVLRHFCRWHSHVFELQSPADAKRFSTDAKLKKIGWYKSTKGGHVNDALRHMLLGAVRHNIIAAEDLL